MDQTMIDHERMIDAASRAAHEANRAYAMFLGEDHISGPWETLDEEMRASTREGVTRAINGETPEMLHQSWLRTKAQAGWRYGPTKDPVAKTHPCMVSYEMLPKAQRLKDLLFQRVARRVAQVAWESRTPEMTR